MNRKLIGILPVLLTAAMVSAAVRLGAVKGDNKWGYAGTHNTLTRPLPAADKLELVLELEAPAPGKESPMPRESWFGILLEDTRQRTRYIWTLFNPSWDAVPQSLAPTLLSYETGGNMQRTAVDARIAPAGKQTLAVTLENGKLTFSCGDRKTQLECRVPEGFSPNLVGVTADCYNTQPVAPIRFDTLAVTAGNEKLRYHFTEKEEWKPNSGRALLQYAAATAAATPVPEETIVTDAGIRNDGLAETGNALQKLFDSGRRALSFPEGTYLVDTLKVPPGAQLRFAPGARLKITGSVELAGNDITIDGAIFEYDQKRPGKLVTAEGRSNLRFLNCSTATWQDGADSGPDSKARPTLFFLSGCRDVLLADGRFADLDHVLRTEYTARITVRDNKALRCGTMTNAGNGSEFLNHTGNWSRQVRFQCMWWGGDSNDTKKGVAPGSARIVRRGETGNDTAGAYDISVQNNFAEHGTTLTWGSKGRNIVISGNIARYMADLAYDTEGGENVVITGNLSINSACAGIGCYFYGERVLIANNQVLVLDEGAESERGNFIRLHSAGKTGHFGNGQILITGNQFIAETAGQRRLVIETAREVSIKGNTFRNGRITASNGNAERITVSENEFETLLSDAEPAIELSGGIEHVISNNRFILRGEGNSAALRLSGNKTRIFLSGNLFLGYHELFQLSDKAAGTLFFSGNEYDGRPGVKGAWRLMEHANIPYDAEAK